MAPSAIISGPLTSGELDAAIDDMKVERTFLSARVDLCKAKSRRSAASVVGAPLVGARLSVAVTLEKGEIL